MSQKSVRIYVSIVLLMTFFLTACSKDEARQPKNSSLIQQPTQQPAPSPSLLVYPNSPIAVTQMMLDAIQENDANKYLDAITPEDRTQPGFFFYKQVIQGLFSSISLGSIDAADVKVSFRDMQFEEIYNDGSIAAVQLTGFLRDLNLAMESDFSSVAVVKNIDGQWLVSPFAYVEEYQTLANSEGATVLQVGLRNIFLGNTAFERARWYLVPLYGETFVGLPDDGWQYVVAEIILENPSSIAIKSSNNLDGILLDSGGFEREMSIYGPTLLIPGVRHLYLGVAEIPLNQIPESIQLPFNNEVYDLTVEQVSPSITIPFEIFPESLPVVENGSITHEEINNYKATYQNFKFGTYYDEQQKIEFDVEIENLRGFNLSPRNLENELTFVAISNDGRYYEDLDVFIDGRELAPGEKEIFYEVQLFIVGKPFTDFNWIWVAAFDSNYHPVGQFQLLADGTILTTFNPNPSLPPTSTPVPTQTFTSTPITPTPTQTLTPDACGNCSEGFLCVITETRAFCELEEEVYADGTANARLTQEAK